MAITEEGRHRMYGRLEEIFGNEVATMLMEHLPPVGWADVATKRDVDHLAAATKRDLDHLGAEFRGEMSALGAALRGEMSVLATDLRGEMSVLRHEFRAELHRELRLTTLALLGGFTAINGITAGLVVGLLG